MVTRMTRSVDEMQRAFADLQAATVLHDPHAIFGNGLQGAVLGLVFLVTVDRPRAGLETRGIDHVTGAARMHDQRRIGQALHQPTGAPGMIEVHVRDDDVADLLEPASSR